MSPCLPSSCEHSPCNLHRACRGRRIAPGPLTCHLPDRFSVGLVSLSSSHPVLITPALCVSTAGLPGLATQTVVFFKNAQMF